MAVDAVDFPFAPEQQGAFGLHERVVCVVGASAAGAVAGLAAAFAMGALPAAGQVLAAAAPVALALYLAARSGLACAQAGAFWPGVVAALNLALIAAWPLGFALIPWGAAELWLIPLAALAGQSLFAALTPDAGAVYRSGAQGALIACAAVHSGVAAYLGG